MKSKIVRLLLAAMVALALVFAVAAPASAATVNNTVRNSASSTYNVLIYDYHGSQHMLRPGTMSQNVGYEHIQKFCIKPLTKAKSQWGYVYRNSSSTLMKCWVFQSNDNYLVLTTSWGWLT